MARLRILSDLHLEFAPLGLRAVEVDAMVLAGDIASNIDSVMWADKAALALGVPVILVAGNHEFYRNGAYPHARYGDTVVALQTLAAQTEGRVSFLENAETVKAGVRFIGATLWTDFALDGTPIASKRAAMAGMNDYRSIHVAGGGHRLNPGESARWHERSRDYLACALAVPFDGPTVVVTHMAPSERSLDRQFAGDTLNPAFASRLDDLVENSGASLWVHGHTHASQDYRIGATRVVCNPRGYAYRNAPDRPENPAFDPDLVVGI